ncbi:MAG: SGNH/GDSL hydrolase family protein [Gemmataceae bacterium]
MRWMILTLVLSLVGLGRTGIAGEPLKGKLDGEQIWYDIRALGLEGQGWTAVKQPFDRLPARAEKLVRPPVWGLSQHSAGLCVRFLTDAPSISARWSVTNPRLDMPHMPATGVSGLDLYVREPGGRWQWLGVGQPRSQATTQILVSGVPEKGLREYLLYLPLYNGVTSVEIGLPRSARLEKAPRWPAHKKPIVFYGTSITQGGCASRPGMVHTAILGRRLDWPVINLGFSGNGRMEIELAQLLGEIDAALYVVDCLPNLGPQEVAERTEPFVKALRKLRPHTPILLVEDRSYSNANILPGPQKRNADNRRALRKAWEKMFREGVASIHYLEGETLLGSDGEATVDSSHPTDLGFLRQADAMEARVKFCLPAAPSARAPIEGYTGQVSYHPGEQVTLHVSCSTPRFRYQVERIGAARQLLTKGEARGQIHPIPEDASSHGCRWPVTVTLDLPTECRSGYYLVTLETLLGTGKKATSEAFFIVRPAHPGKETKILLQLATNTWNAYTNWGGYSLYAYHGANRVQGRRVSFARPQTSQFANWELPFLAWAEQAGYTIDVCANSDLEFYPELLASYKLVLSVGHDEYWSAPMRDHLEKFITGGGNVAFLSGNTCCWQVRSEEKGRALVCYKQAYQADPLHGKGDPRLLSTLWSHHLVGRPENTLTGVGFLWGGYHRSHGQHMQGSGAFTVYRPDHWLLAGTSLKRGEEFGGKDTIVGYECDGCELVWKDGLPSPTHRDGTPPGFTVVATAPAQWHPDDCEWYEKWDKGRSGHAVVGTYTRGGTVVTVGTTDWAHGLRGKDARVVRITRNILDRLGK